GTDAVWFYDMQADGLSLDDKRQPVERNDIPDLVQRWHFRDLLKDVDRGEKAFFVSKESIVENGYDLSINRYKEVEYAEVVYESPKTILGKLKALEDEIRADLDELEGML
ncbi:N-6 DNA methylase, partial [Chamaesiphon sp. VAR_69_metabat_338]|uniref:N-6 DNA methylase n=1 Tax=Chamaesiphon sp. VAR_69_metabat_338 TaxID=2964704 RepID=UPI00286E3757